MSTAHDPQFDTCLSDLCFGEGPRWHNGELYLSDMHAHEVLATDGAGSRRVIASVPNRPSGLGFLPDGSLLIVSMLDQRLLRLHEGRLDDYADLSDLASSHCNDMVVDAAGRAWVGNFGFDFQAGETRKAAELIVVTGPGDARVVAGDLKFPNGMVITPDGSTLIVGESMGRCLTAFDIGESSDLVNRRTWADFPDRALPDGICLDEAGGIWAASPSTSEVLRIEAGGAVTARLATGDGAFACMLGGDDRRTLYVLVAASSDPDECARARSGRLLATRVTHAGAGLP